MYRTFSSPKENTKKRRTPGRSWFFLLASLFILQLTLPGSIHPEKDNTTEKVESSGFIYRVSIHGPITPSTMEYLQDSIDKANEDGAYAILLKLDTPGGLVSSMDEMIRSILSSPIPVITFISPQGASCGSAGVYILYASHIAAMAPATNIGSATPVSIGGGGTPEGDGTIPEEAGANDAVNLKRKQLNHAIAQIHSLADYRKRNRDFAERSITRAENITSLEARKINVIDYIADSDEALLQKAHDRNVRMVTENITLHLKDKEIRDLEADTRMEFLNVLSNPSLAYILLMIGILGILAEVQNPGGVVPGVVGGICLLLGLYAMQSLPVNYVGLGLIMFGMILFIVEIFTPTFGILSLGGFISLVLGSFILIDSSDEAFAVSTVFLLSTSIGVGSIAAFMIYKASKTLRSHTQSGDAKLIGSRGESTTAVNATGGKVYLHSEYWNAVSTGDEIPAATTVEVVNRSGMVLTVKKI